MNRLTAWGWLPAALALACAAAEREAPPTGDAGGATGAAAATAADSARAQAPISATGTQPKGTLDFDELGIRLVGRGRNAGLRIDVTTLDDQAIALAAEDIGTYFRDLKTRISETVPEPQARELTPFLVGYTGFEKQVAFDPTLLQIRSEGSSYYPRFIIPVSPTFDRRLVDLYETVYAIYLFDPALDLFAPLEFQYTDLTSGNDWLRVVREIQRAKSRTETRPE